MKLCEFRLYLGMFHLYLEEKRFRVDFGTWYGWFYPSKAGWLGIPICVELEYDKYGPLFSLNVNILGLGGYISWNTPWETKQSIKLKTPAEEGGLNTTAIAYLTDLYLPEPKSEDNNTTSYNAGWNDCIKITKQRLDNHYENRESTD